MRQPQPLRRYALARPRAGELEPDERMRRLRLVRMEAIADAEREGRGEPKAPPTEPPPAEP